MLAPEDLEPEMEALLLRIVPGLARQWKGATEAELERLEHFAGKPLPRFYRWFMSRMGKNMGGMSFPRTDFSAARILALYEQGEEEIRPGALLIAHELDELMPYDTYYDLNLPARDDARVVGGLPPSTGFTDRFETLREFFGWHSLSRFRFCESPQRCDGTFAGESAEAVVSNLQPVMTSLGFTCPIATGSYCGLFERADEVLITRCTPGVKAPNLHTFSLGGRGAGRLRKILGVIATETPIKVEIDSWDPSLGGS